MSFQYHHLDKWLLANSDLIEEALENNKKAVVLISGASSSGKSYCADSLKGFLRRNGHKACIISLDQYNFGISGIIPNKVNLHYFDDSLENMDEIRKRIKKVIYSLPFDQKYSPSALKEIRSVLSPLLDEKKLDTFLLGLSKEWKNLNFDEASVYDLREACHDVKMLLKEKRVTMKKYSKVTSEREINHSYLDGKDYDVIIVEGIYALDETMLSHLTHVNYISNFIASNPKSLFLRRIIRDSKSTSASNAFTISIYFKYIVPAYNETILPCKENADVVFNNEMSFSEMRNGDLYTTKMEFFTKDKRIIEELIRDSQAEKPSYQRDTYFVAPNEDGKNNNVLRLRAISNDKGKTYVPSSLVHKGVPKVRKDNKVIRPINILLQDGEATQIWENESECMRDFIYAGFSIGPIQKKKKMRLTYKGQKITLREVDNKGYFIEFSLPYQQEVVEEITRKIEHSHD